MQEKEYYLKIESNNLDLQSGFRGLDYHEDEIWIAGSKSRVYYLNNDSDLWNEISLPDSSLELRDVEILAPGKALVLSVHQPAQIWMTENYGQNWQVVFEGQDSMMFLDALAIQKDEEEQIRSIWAYGDPDSSGFLVLKSGADGKSWDRIAPKNLPKPRKDEAGFAASGACIAFSGDRGKKSSLVYY
jgi:photosystem II stability/assembly factor-like uncharacterized protein